MKLFVLALATTLLLTPNLKNDFKFGADSSLTSVSSIGTVHSEDSTLTNPPIIGRKYFERYSSCSGPSIYVVEYIGRYRYEGYLYKYERMDEYVHNSGLCLYKGYLTGYDPTQIQPYAINDAE